MAGWVWVSMGIPGWAQNQVSLEIVDADSEQPIPARVEFTRSGKKANRDRKSHAVGDAWLVEGTLHLQPAPGDYEFLARRGPEFPSIRGGFTVERGTRDTILVEIPRSVDMHSEGWFSGDLSAELPAGPLARWQKAEALDLAVHTRILGSPFPANKATEKIVESKTLSGGDPERVGHGWIQPSLEIRRPECGIAVHPLPGSSAALGESELPTPESVALLESDIAGWLETHEGSEDFLIELTQPAAADVPWLLTHPRLRCVRLLGVANRPSEDEALSIPKDDKGSEFGNVVFQFGRDRVTSPIAAPLDRADRIRYRGGRGHGLLAEQLYWKMLDAGLRLAPTAASGFGKSETHLGYNRVYVYLQSEPTAERWWHFLERGASTVTNGPLLRTMINGLPPGSVLAGQVGSAVPLDIAVSLAVREKVDYIDLVFNGETIYSAKLEEHYRKGEFPPMSIEESGWLVVRVVTEHEAGYRLSTTAPFYFEFGGQPRVSRSAAEFFQEWLQSSIDASEGSDAPPESAARGRWLERAVQFWNDRASMANAP